MPEDPTPPADAQPPRATDASAWSPEGLELARAVASSVAGGSTLPGLRRRRSRRANGGRRTRAGAAEVSGAAPDDRDPQLLDSTIGRLVAERGWTTDVAVAGAMARWAQIVGSAVAEHCRAESYADAELTVRADSTAWATQVRLLAPTVLKRLNEELGDGTVNRIVVVGPSGPSWRRGPRSVRDGRGPRDTYG